MVRGSSNRASNSERASNAKKSENTLLHRPEFRSSPYLARVYAMAGRREDALKLVPRLTRLASRFDEPAMAMMFFDLGDRDRGFQWLARAFDHHTPTVPFVRSAPDFDNVRSDPRFQALVARLRIPD